MRSGIFVSGTASDIKVSGNTVQFTLAGSGGSRYHVTAPGTILPQIPKEDERVEVEGELSFLDGTSHIWARSTGIYKPAARRRSKDARIRDSRF